MNAPLQTTTGQVKGKDECMVGNIIVKNVGSGIEMKPYEIFSAMSGYIVPTIDALKKPTTGGNAAQELTFNVLKDIGKKNRNKPYHAFDNPVDDTTGTFRKRLETALGTDYTAAKADAHVMTSEELYEMMN